MGIGSYRIPGILLASEHFGGYSHLECCVRYIESIVTFYQTRVELAVTALMHRIEKSCLHIQVPTYLLVRDTASS